MKSLILGLALLLTTTTHATTTIPPVDEFDLSQYQGKVVYLDFWASWCGPCQKSFPWMNAMVEEHKRSGLEVIAVTVDEDVSEAQKFLEKLPAQFKVFSDHDGRLAERYKLLGMPSSFLFGRDGRLIYQHKGFRKKDQGVLADRIRAALEETIK